VKRPQRYCLSLSSFAGVVPCASHWWCRVRWTDATGEEYEADAENGRGDKRTGRFNTKAAARAAGLRLVRKIAHDPYIVTEGSHCVIDPQQTLSGPPRLKTQLNALWRKFEALNGWSCPKDAEPKVQAICDAWSKLLGESTR
jgi:hypothetical protein